MLGILITTLLFVGIMIGLSWMVNVKEIKTNWAKYRCRPDMMMMAALFGKDAQENLEFCLKQGFDSRAEGVIAPFYTLMGGFVGVLTTLLGSINSVKMVFATIVGSSSTVFSEFSQRFQALMYRIQMTTIRIKFLFGRVFGIINAILFMGMGGMRAGLNLSNTFLFKFLDTFCFDPSTPIEVFKGDRIFYIPICDIQIGDTLASGDRVTATFAFYADGQPMVKTKDGTLVSTNHYMKYKDMWIKAKNHPDVVPAADWSGGTERPLICLNTTSHTFKIGNYTFRDYDETSDGDVVAMEKAMRQMNGGQFTSSETIDSTMACHPATPICLYSEKVPASLPAEDIQLGMRLSTGVVHGIITKLTKNYCVYKGVKLAPGTAVWDEERCIYRRVADIVPTLRGKSEGYISFIISPGATIETKNGVMFRDYMEVHNPELEESYTKALESLGSS